MWRNHTSTKLTMFPEEFMKPHNSYGIHEIFHFFIRTINAAAPELQLEFEWWDALHFLGVKLVPFLATWRQRLVFFQDRRIPAYKSIAKCFNWLLQIVILYQWHIYSVCCISCVNDVSERDFFCFLFFFSSFWSILWERGCSWFVYKAIVLLLEVIKWFNT